MLWVTTRDEDDVVVIRERCGAEEGREERFFPSVEHCQLQRMPFSELRLSYHFPLVLVFRSMS